MEELETADSAELNDDNEYNLAEEKHFEEVIAAGRVRVPPKQCKRWWICSRKPCPIRRLCGKRKGYCDIFIGCICNRRVCQKKYHRFCIRPPCRRLLVCIRRKCPHCRGRHCGHAHKLCKCQKEVCKWKFKVICPRYPRWQSEIQQMDENMAQIERLCDANFDANVESEMINDVELESDEE